MTTCSETLEDNALVTIANQDALIQKLDTYQDDLSSKIKSTHENQSQKLELIDMKMATCSETMEENALVAIANQDALIQKLDTNKDDLTSKMNSMQDLVQSQGQNMDDMTGRLDSLEDLVEDQRD